MSLRKVTGADILFFIAQLIFDSFSALHPGCPIFLPRSITGRVTHENLNFTACANASHHRQQKAERRRSGAFCCPSACDC